MKFIPVLTFFALVLSFTFSMLILPHQIPQITEESFRYFQPELVDTSAPISAASSADPVQGIQNATSGYLSVNDPKTASKLFYVFYSCRNLKRGQVPKDVPILIWLQGGPGGSSFMGAFKLFGPSRLEKDSASGRYKEVRNDRSWNDYYNLLIIDNPRGTGYSVADQESYIHTQDEVAEDLLNAILNFYSLEAFSTFDKTPLYIFGESYGGHYIPSISKRVLQYNSWATKKIPLAGIGIGDGWTDPIRQLPNNDLFGFSLGFFDYNERLQIQKSQLLGIGNILSKRYEEALNNFGDIFNLTVTAAGGINIYNFREFGQYDWTPINIFFNDAENAKRYNVDPRIIGTFTYANLNVYNALKKDFMQSVADRIAFVANSGLPVILYNGQYDVIVNTPNAMGWIRELQWSGQQAFYNTPIQNWIYNNGSTVGFAKNYKNFTFVILNKAGHFAPKDQLNTTIEMVRRFTSGNNKWNQTFNG